MKWHGEYETDRLIWDYFPSGFAGNCVDVGAGNGILLSNTYVFEQAGWNCLCIEANRNHEAELRKNRKNVMICAVGAEPGKDTLKIFEPPKQPGWQLSMTGLKPFPKLLNEFKLIESREVDVKTLDQCIAEFGGFDSIDYVTIDVEGSECDVLKGFDLKRWKPKLLVIEDFASWRWSGETPHAKIYMEANGYRMDRALKYNQFFVPA